MTTALVALGSNLGDRTAHLRAALAHLAQIPSSTLEAVAAFRETRPVDCPPEMPAFINSAAKLNTTLSAHDFLAHLLAIETALGRQRTAHVEPQARTIDLDLLLFGSEIISLPHLTVPHPRMHKRIFVLQPLTEIAPEFPHPLLGKTMRELLHQLQPAPVGVSSP